MRVPDTGQPLYERRIIRDGKRFAEQMLAGYSVRANGRFVPDAKAGSSLTMAMLAEALTGAFRRVARNSK